MENERGPLESTGDQQQDAKLWEERRADEEGEDLAETGLGDWRSGVSREVLDDNLNLLMGQVYKAVEKDKPNETEEK